MQDMLYENSNAALKLVVTHFEGTCCKCCVPAEGASGSCHPCTSETRSNAEQLQNAGANGYPRHSQHGAGEAWGDITVLGLLSI